MSLKTFVKIGNINNLSDARYCAGMMVDILGFNLEEGTEGYVSSETFKEISEWIAGVKFAGEFKNALPTEIKLAAIGYNLDFIEVQNIDHLEELQQMDQELILKVVVSEHNDLDKLPSQLVYASEFVAFVIIHCQQSSLFDSLQIVLSKSGGTVRIIRSYGLSEANAPAIAKDPVFYGIELEGSPEERPGFKDYGEVMDILELLEEI